MSSYSDKQKELDNASYALYESINQFTELIDKTGGIITLQAKNLGDKIEDKILNLHHLAEKFEASHHQISWAGSSMPSNQLFQMIILVLEEEIEKHTTFRFSRLDGILRDKSPYQEKAHSTEKIQPSFIKNINGLHSRINDQKQDMIFEMIPSMLIFGSQFLLATVGLYGAYYFKDFSDSFMFWLCLIFGCVFSISTIAALIGHYGKNKSL
ncbi:hypothetical protein [Pedobacter sp. Leaf132]|uniref:hypothetical protein n=1 Tax=Pedobacter sp. Leaf132 TaxID=2876557 RepID=UPI001E393614|nr:hypothetical protein [Pedobacter sp. Leaf132]